MYYQNIRQGIFIIRPNRFIAHIEIDGKNEICHVKNTGRCRELLIPGAIVYVQESDNPNRRTRFDLIAVRKGNRLINVDSSAPNKLFREWVISSGFFGPVDKIFPERRFGDSRLDYYIESADNHIFVEVKGVTLEDNGIVRFPDAPTERGVRHMGELVRCIGDGYSACAAFVIQMDDVLYFEPNWETHPAFGQALISAQNAGVKLIAFQCCVTENSIIPGDPVEIRL